MSLITVDRGPFRLQYEPEGLAWSLEGPMFYLHFRGAATLGEFYRARMETPEVQFQNPGPALLEAIWADYRAWILHDPRPSMN